MNKYQKQKSKEIKAIMRIENAIVGVRWRTNAEITYKQAKYAWNLYKRLQYFYFTPCEDCDNSRCKGQKNVIAYCPERM